MPGMQDSSSVLVNQTNDGVPLDKLWSEIEDVTRLHNQVKDNLVSLLTYRTTVPADAVPQHVRPQLMEEASERGVPRAIGEQDYLKVGYRFTDYDLASRLTWRYLRSASAEQVRSTVTRMLESDRFTVQSTVFNRLFSPAEQSNDWGHRVFGAWNGDGTVPPSFMGRAFAGAHQHYLTTNGDDLDSQDVELLISHVTEHGYALTSPGSRILLLCNPAEAEIVSSWRAGQPSRTDGPLAKHSFIPSSATVPYLTTETLVGQAPPDTLGNVPIIGQYGRALVVSDYVVPQGYFAVVATYGFNSEDNPIAFREHPNPDYQGLRFIPGNQQRYPIIETFTARGFGVGTRRRGAFAVAKLGTGSYTTPTITVA